MSKITDINAALDPQFERVSDTEKVLRVFYKLRAAALMAVDALDSDDPTIQSRAALNLRAALAESAQKPMHPEIKKMYEDYFDKCYRESSAQQRPWVGLTDEEINEITSKVIGFNSCAGWEEDYARAIEQALKEKNR